MCSQYWNLIAEVECPNCHVKKERELQTHWMGEPGSCVNYYKLGDPVEELKGIIAAVLNGENDDFIGNCDTCTDTRWVQCGYCDGTGIRPEWANNAGEPCTMCEPGKVHGNYRNEVKDGKRGWWNTSPVYFDCGARIENGAVTEVWVLKKEEKVEETGNR